MGAAGGCTGTAVLGCPAARRPMHACFWRQQEREFCTPHDAQLCRAHTLLEGETQAGPKPLTEALASGATFLGFWHCRRSACSKLCVRLHIGCACQVQLLWMRPAAQGSRQLES